MPSLRIYFVCRIDVQLCYKVWLVLLDNVVLLFIMKHAAMLPLS